MREQIRPAIHTPRHSRIAATIIVPIALALGACGSPTDDDQAIASSDGATATSIEQTSGQSPFTAVTECLIAEGIDAVAPDFQAPGGNGERPTGGSIPPDGSIPPGVSFPSNFSVPEGGFPEGGVPEGPRGSLPEGGLPTGSIPPGAGGGAGRQMDPTFLAEMFGLDATDPTVATVIESCSDQMGGPAQQTP